MCWHRIKNDESGNCPNCREPYKDEPYKFAPLTPEQEQKLKELRAREANQSKIVRFYCVRHNYLFRRCGETETDPGRV